MPYLFLDDEMGGIGKEYSLLTVYLMCLDDEFKIINDLYLYLKPDDGIYKVCGPALSINQIDLEQHDLKAITYKEAGNKLYNWLKNLTDDGKQKLTVVGHGVYGDVELIIHHLMSRGSWEKFTSYRKLDTQAVVQFLISCNILPNTISGSLESLVKHFNIPLDSTKLHDAKYDTEKTFDVFMHLRELLMQTDSWVENGR